MLSFGESLQPEQIQQAIDATDPDGSYRRQIEGHTLECTGFIGGREKAIREELLKEGYKAVYQITEFPCQLDRERGVMRLHMPDFIILGKTDKSTGTVYTVTAQDEKRLPLWNPHGSVRNSEARKYDSFYSRFGSTFEITFFVNSAASVQKRLSIQNARIADRIVTAPNPDVDDSKKLTEVKEVVRKELGRLVLKEDGHGSVTELALIECMREAKRQKEEYTGMQAERRIEARTLKATVLAR